MLSRGERRRKELGVALTLRNARVTAFSFFLPV